MPSRDSMNEAEINDGDLILVKQQSIADNGQNVVALIDDKETIKTVSAEGGCSRINAEIKQSYPPAYYPGV